MKNRKILFLIFSVFAFAACKAQNNNSALVKSFIQDLANDQIGYESIIKKHLCVDNTEQQEKKIMLVTSQLRSLRLEFRGNSYMIENYQKLSAKDQNIQIEEKEKQNIYRLESKGKIICFIWVKDGKVVAFSTMRKGNMRFFLKICD